MPIEAIEFIIGLLLGYYLLSPSFRGILNNILYKLFQISHHLVLWFLGLIVICLGWCYNEQQHPVPRVQGKMIQGQTPQTARAAVLPPKTVAPKVGTGDISKAKTVKLDDGSTAFIFTPEKLEELMAKNPDLKITEKEENE